MPVRTRWGGCDADGVAGYQAQRSINGGAWTSITLPSATTTTLVQSLSIGSTYRYRVRARDTLGVYGSWRYGPTFRPLATDQASSAVTWGGSWATASTTSAFKGSLRYSNSANAWSSYTFNGASVAWVAYRGPTRGSAKVYLDGVYQGTVSLYASTTAARPIIYAFNWSATGTHTIKVVVVGTAGHPRVDVDAFILLYRY
jgi:hypothetical protein